MPAATLLADAFEGLTPLLLLGGVVLITAAFMMRLARRNKQQHLGNDLTGAERLERLRQQEGVRGDLESLMVEIEEMAKRLGHQLDAKAIRIETLLEEADHRLSRMKHLAERLESAAAMQPASADTPPASATEATPPGEPEDALTRSVYALADEGLGPGDIARRLDEHAGKVELILALREA